MRRCVELGRRFGGSVSDVLIAINLEDLSELSPGSVVRPFLDVIRHEQASSTLTGSALEAVQNLLHEWPWAATDCLTTKEGLAIADAVSDVVDAVSQCRFQETNAESDQNVLVLVVHTLHSVIRSPCAWWLSDHSAWQLVESLYALSRAGRHDVRTPQLIVGLSSQTDCGMRALFGRTASYHRVAPLDGYQFPARCDHVHLLQHRSV